MFIDKIWGIKGTFRISTQLGGQSRADGRSAPPGGAMTDLEAPVPFRSNQPIRPSAVGRWLALQNIKVLNIAGNRESGAPGIGTRVEAFLGRLFKITQRPAAS